MGSGSKNVSLVLTRARQTHDSETDIQELRCCLYRLTIRVLGSKIKSGIHDAIALENQKSDTTLTDA
jgi:hypothetical protein